MVNLHTQGPEMESHLPKVTGRRWRRGPDTQVLCLIVPFLWAFLGKQPGSALPKSLPDTHGCIAPALGGLFVLGSWP